MWQESVGWSVLPWQSWKPPKSPAAPPAIETTIGDDVTLVTVACWFADVCPTLTSPNSKRVGVIRNCVCVVCDAPAAVASTANASAVQNNAPQIR